MFRKLVLNGIPIVLAITDYTDAIQALKQFGLSTDPLHWWNCISDGGYHDRTFYCGVLWHRARISVSSVQCKQA